MVLKSKGGKKCRSGISKKKEKQMMKHHRKENFKNKKEDKQIECCVCMEEIVDCSDNVVTCGKVNHPLCRECKKKCKDCPMCRSHPVKPPISQEVSIPILSSSCKIQGEYPKKKISVEIKRRKKSFLSGIYHEIRRDKYNYPIYKKLDEDKYIVHDPPFWKGDHECSWTFCVSPDSGDHPFWLFKNGKLMGNHVWTDIDDQDELNHYNVTITRI